MKPAENPPPPALEAVFTLKRAAEVAGVSTSTLRRNKETLREHGATITEHGWKVPMSALIASGLMRRTTPPDQPAPAPRAAEAPGEDQTAERVRELEREALELRHRAELAEERQRAAEAVARERGEALEDVRAAMRMLTAGPSSTAPSAPETASPAPAGPAEPPAPEMPAPAEQSARPPTGQHARPRRRWRDWLGR